MNLLPAVLRRNSTELEAVRDQVDISLDEWIAYVNEFQYNGLGYITVGAQQTMPGQTQEPIGPAYRAITDLAYKTNGVVFSCMLTRMLHFAEARFQFRQMNSGRPGKLFGTQDLSLLEAPWIGGTTGDLLTRMIQHADLGGNAFVVNRGDKLVMLRPDWVTIVLGSETDPSMGAWSSDAEILGYVYTPGGTAADASDKEVFMPDEVAHFAPIPDPEARFRGMSWLTPLLREVMADKAATETKLRFFENPTPNMVVKFDVPDLDEFKKQVAAFKDAHMGARNAYKWMFTASGVDTTVVGSNMHDLDFKLITGAGETRIAAAARTPPVIVGLSEGLQGSALNSGNYQAARRMFADGCIRPLWRNAAGSLANIITVPGGAELWYDDRDVAFLKEDLQERASVQQTKAQAIRYLVDAGYKPDTVIDAIEAEDMSLLEHSGLFSVQLQAAGAPKQGLFTGVPVPTDQGAAQQAIAEGEDPNSPKALVAGNGNGNGNGRSLDPALLEALIARGDTHIHFDEGAFTAPPAPDVHIHEGAIRAEVTTPDVHVEAPTTFEPGSIQVDGPEVTFEEGSIRTEVTTPDVHVAPAEVTIEEGAIRVEAPPATEVEVRMDMEPFADGLRSLADAPPAQITVEAPHVTVEPSTVELVLPERALEVTVPDQPAPVVNITNEVQTPEVNVTVPEQPAPVVNVNLEDEPLQADVKFKRNRDGSLDSAQITETGGDDG